MSYESELANETKSNLKALIIEHYSLLSILIGTVLVSISIGPFHNIDTQLEYEAALGVIRWGMPYMINFGNMINQPPLGFYFEALFFTGFGLSFDKGVALITSFGLGCTFLVYEIGKMLYGKRTGLFAAALFALTPWQLTLSRSFLIDEQCLFFSLLFLFAGICAIRKDSFKLFMVSGILFAAAFLTKFFAVFTLIPLVLFYIYYRPKNLRRTFSWLGAFFLPALLFAFLWYQVISGEGLLSVFYHGDFNYFSSGGFVPSYFFVGNFLVYGLGVLFLAAAVLSLLTSLFAKSFFSKIFAFDLICFVTIVTVVAVNTFLGTSLNLYSPYRNAIKYDYQSLPFF